MDREPVRRVGGRSRHLGWAVSAALVFALLWVPSVGRARQSMAVHVAASTTKLSKSAVLPHDPTSAFVYIAPASGLAPIPVESFRPVIAPADPSAVDRAHEGIGLRAPPASIL